MMMKKACLRALLGVPLGIAIGQVMTIFSSLAYADASYSPCVPGFVETMGSELAAVIAQTALCALLGAGFAACSVIWEIEHWSIARQTGVYFLLTSLIMLPIAYCTNWMEHSLSGFASYFGVFALIFLLVWAVQYWIWKRRLQALNGKINGA